MLEARPAAMAPRVNGFRDADGRLSMNAHQWLGIGAYASLVLGFYLLQAPAVGNSTTRLGERRRKIYGSGSQKLRPFQLSFGDAFHPPTRACLVWWAMFVSMGSLVYFLSFALMQRTEHTG